MIAAFTVLAKGGLVMIPLALCSVLALAVAIGSFVAIWRYRVNVVWVIAAAGLVGLVAAMLA